MTKREKQEFVALEALNVLQENGIICVFTGGNIKSIEGWEIKKRGITRDLMVVEGCTVLKEENKKNNLMKSNQKEGLSHMGHLVAVMYEGRTIAVVPVTKAISQGKLYELSHSSDFTLRLIPKASTKNMAIPEAVETEDHLTGGTTVEDNLAYQKARMDKAAGKPWPFQAESVENGNYAKSPEYIANPDYIE